MDDDYVTILRQRHHLLYQALKYLKQQQEERDRLPTKRRRHVYPRPDYTQSTWWRMLEKGDCKILGHREYDIFRRRFAVTFERYKEFVEKARSWNMSKETDALNRPSVPLEIKVLGALRMVAKGCSFDAIAELSGMSIQTMQRFFHRYMDLFVKEFKDEWIKYPKTFAEAEKFMEHYKKLGFPGAVTSVDATHVLFDMCPVGLASIYTGKEGVPTIAYEVAVSPMGECLFVTMPGHPGSRNDKTIVKTDDFIQQVKNHEILYDDVEFELFTEDDNTITIRGCWIMVTLSGDAFSVQSKAAVALPKCCGPHVWKASEKT